MHFLPANDFQRLFAVGCLQRLKAPVRQRTSQRLAKIAIVVSDQEAWRYERHGGKNLLAGCVTAILHNASPVPVATNSAAERRKPLLPPYFYQTSQIPQSQISGNRIHGLPN